MSEEEAKNQKNQKSNLNLPETDLEQEFELGIKLFNEHNFYDCHEVLELVWRQQKGAERELTQGIIQVAVAYYHAFRGNRYGAIKLWQKGLARIKPFLPVYAGFILSEFYLAASKDLDSHQNNDEKPSLLPTAIKKQH